MHANSRASRKAFTLVEVMLTIGSTAMIGLGIAYMLAATSYGTDGDKELRSAVVKQHLITGRLNAAIRSSRMVLASGTSGSDEYMVIWMADTTDDDEPNLSEIRRIQRDDSSGELRSYRAPNGVTPDTQYPLGSTNFNNFGTSSLLPLMGSSDLPEQRWATGVTGLTVSLDNGNSQLATKVGYQVTIEDGDMSDSTVGLATLRNFTN